MMWPRQKVRWQPEENSLDAEPRRLLLTKPLHVTPRVDAMLKAFIVGKRATGLLSHYLSSASMSMRIDQIRG